MAEEDTEFKKLPIDEQCVHKSWKARVNGYEEAKKLFGTLDEKAPEWNKYLGLIKKFVIDSNVVAQEKGLEATLVFVENCANAGKTVGEVMNGIVTKCMGAPKAKTKELAVNITMMYIEIEKHEAVLEDLLKGTEQKNPKIVATCVSTLTQALREFGAKVVSVKPIVKKLQTLLSDRDKTVRDETKSLAIEMFRWIGPAFKTQIASLPEVMLKELDAEFEKVKSDKAYPSRYLRSQQEKQAAAVAAEMQCDAENGDADVDEADHEEIDPLDLVDPVEILSKIPKDFYEKLEQKKWQDRKEALEAIEPLLKNPKLVSGDYGDLVRALKKVITKDTNVVLVAMAGKLLANLAAGLGKHFSPYATSCIQSILEKFKEKKANVVMALREAIDNIYPVTNLENILEDLIEALANKNPAVKFETASFLARIATKTQPTVFNKKLLKALVGALIKTLNEPDPGVRDASAEALGTLLKLLGDKTMGPFLTDVEELKMAKVKDFSEKAVITIKIVGAKKERPVTAPPKAAPARNEASKPVSRPQTSAGAKKPPVKKSAPAPPVSKSASTKSVATERDLTPEEVDEKAGEILPPDVINGLGDANWKTRLTAVESFQSTLADLEPKNGLSQVLMRVMAKKPGLKENNFQVLKLRLDVVKEIVEKFGLTATTADYILNDLAEKLGDPKNSMGAIAALTAVIEATQLDYVVTKVMTFAFEQKSPKVQQEVLNFVNGAIRDFGFKVNSKVLLEDTRKAVQSTNPAVRSCAIALLGTMHLYMGNSLVLFFDGEKPALKQQIMAEFEKNAGQKAPPPSRGVSKSSSKASFGIDDDQVEEIDDDDTAMNAAADALPRTDISPFITEALLNEICDKNWKTRNEGLDKVAGIINEAKLIKSNLGDLPQVLAQRLVDSNAKIAQSAFEICEKIANAMGPPCKQYTSVLFPGLFKGLGDSKVYIRTAAIKTINAWCDQTGYKEVFSGEMVADALKTGSPALKTELFGWLAEKLPNIPTKTIQKEELIACLPHLYASLIDRNADVRKNANEAVLGIMIHIGYDAMLKVCDKQKPASKKDIQAALDKARPNLPIKPLPKNKQQAPIVEESSRPQSKSASARNVKAGPAKPAAARSKKEEEIDTSPMLAENNTKAQRLLDEQKLKVLKWSFTTPREEFIDLLKDQMSTANVNRNLMANMFHDDFRYHLKAIDQLTEDLPGNLRGLMCNLDLVLKWLSLRFYDTNPSVLLKGLDYLNQAFQYLIENNYQMAENEGSSFIPHILTKIGDTKDAVRNGVKQVLREICCMHPFNKVFGYIMEASKSKSARQRAECLEECAYLIEMYNLQTLYPSAPVAIKEIAKNISDRDNTVRNAALNCMVQLYFILGEKLYKMIGQLSEKEQSMLDERIKRSTKRPPQPRIVKPEIVKPVAPVVTPVNPEPEMEDLPVDDDLPSEIEQIPVQNHRDPNATYSSSHSDTTQVIVSDSNRFLGDLDSPVKMNGSKSRHHSDSTFERSNNKDSLNRPSFECLSSTFAENTNKNFTEQQFRRPTGPFKLDQNVIEDIERNWIRCDQLKKSNYPQLDLQFLEEPLKSDGVYPAEKLEALMTNANYTSPLRPTTAPTRQFNFSPLDNAKAAKPKNDLPLLSALPNRVDPELMKLVTNVGNSNKLVANAALIEVAEILQNKDKQAVLRDLEVHLIDSLLQQYKHLSHRPIVEALAMYQPLLHATYSFFLAPNLGKQLPIQTIKQLMSVLLGLMADNKLDSVDDQQYMKVVNGICLKILDAANFTYLNCALIRLLKETCSTSALPKFTELLMKCIWRNVKVLPDRRNELDYPQVLKEINDFLTMLPSTWWQTRPSDTPFRTIRTIIHNMTRIKGHSIMTDVADINACSELSSYIMKVLKKENSVNGDASSTNAKEKEGPKRLSRSHQEQIADIFKLISDRATSQEGLNKLYDFKTQNPSVDLESIINGSNPTFKRFIADGLKEVERERIVSCSSDNRNGPMGGNAQPDQWLERLNKLKMKANLAESGSLPSGMIDNKIADENLNQFQASGLRKPPATSSTNNVNPSVTRERLQLIQDRINQMKANQPQ